MKTKNLNIRTAVFLILSSFVFFFACKDEEELFPETRLFRPVLNEDLFSEGNSIIVNMGKMKKATSYTLEVSRDTFKTIDYTIAADTNFVVINSELTGEELLWFTIYQVRAIAHASDSEYDSKVSDLGNVRTQKFPSNQGVPTFFDVTDVRARVFWTTAGAPVTEVKVFAIDDLRLETPLLEFVVGDDEREAEEKIISGLEPETEYQIAIYSDGVIRGWEVYTTKAPEPSGDNVIDLKGIYKPSILVDTLPDIPGGSIVILESGLNYELTSGYQLDRSVTLRRGYGFSPDMPVIEFGLHKGFDVLPGSSIDSVVFKDIALRGPYDGSFLFYLNNSGTVGEIKFDACVIGPLRGGMRINSGTGTLEKLTVVDCLVDSLKDFNFVYMQGKEWTVGDITIKNSTFSKIGSSFIRSANNYNTNSIAIESCTFMETTQATRYIFDWGVDGVEVTNGISIHNSIWGPGWNPSGGEDVAIKGFNKLASTNFDIVNTWATSDFLFSGNEIPGFPSFTYSKTAADLWVSPYTDLDFNFKDTGFSGKSDSGDPRWRVGL